jgi:plastocyanin
VIWVNQDSAPHTVTFDDGSVASGRLLQGDTFSHTFDQVGTYPLYCELHGGPGGRGMSMVVTVVESLESVTPAPAATEPAAAATEAMEMATAEAPAATEAAPAPGSVSVDMENYEFTPDAITITAGTTVIWTNKDLDGHTVTSDEGSIDSGNLDTDETFSYTFDQPGTYPFYCTYHGDAGGVGMHMTVTVTG